MHVPLLPTTYRCLPECVFTETHPEKSKFGNLEVIETDLCPIGLQVQIHHQPTGGTEVHWAAHPLSLITKVAGWRSKTNVIVCGGDDNSVFAIFEWAFLNKERESLRSVFFSILIDKKLRFLRYKSFCFVWWRTMNQRSRKSPLSTSQAAESHLQQITFKSFKSRGNSEASSS